MHRVLFGTLKLMALMIALFAVIGCGGSGSQTTLPKPLGAANGQNTFLLFYTDN